MEHLSTDTEVFCKNILHTRKGYTRTPQFLWATRAPRAPACKSRAAQSDSLRNKVRPKVDIPVCKQAQKSSRLPLTLAAHEGVQLVHQCSHR